VYSINKPKDESLAILKILSNVKGAQKIMKQNRLLEQLEVAGLFFCCSELTGSCKLDLIALIESNFNNLFPFIVYTKYV